MPNKQSKKKHLMVNINSIKRGGVEDRDYDHLKFLAEQFGMMDLLQEAIILGNEVKFHNLLDKIKSGKSRYISRAEEFCDPEYDYDDEIGTCGFGVDPFAENNERLLYLAIQKCNQVNPKHTDDSEWPTPTPIQERIERLVSSSPFGYCHRFGSEYFPLRASEEEKLSGTLQHMDDRCGRGRSISISEEIAGYHNARLNKS